MNQADNDFLMSRWYASYVMLDLQIVHLFAIRLVRSIVQLRWHVRYLVVEWRLFKDKPQHERLGNIILSIYKRNILLVNESKATKDTKIYIGRGIGLPAV